MRPSFCMALNDQSLVKKEQSDLIKQIESNKESIDHGFEAGLWLAGFTVVSYALITNNPNSNSLAMLCPIISAGTTLFMGAVTTINLYKLKQAKKSLKEITESIPDKTSQNPKKAVQTNYEHRRETTPVPQTLKLR